MQVYQIAAANTDWTEAGATWNKKVHPTTAWAGSVGCGTAGTDYVNTVIGTLTVPNPAAGHTEFSTALTAAVVQGWMTANQGILIRESAVRPSGTLFCSSDFDTAVYRPKLVIEYTEPVAGRVGIYGCRSTIALPGGVSIRAHSGVNL